MALVLSSPGISHPQHQDLKQSPIPVDAYHYIPPTESASSTAAQVVCMGQIQSTEPLLTLNGQKPSDLLA